MNKLPGGLWPVMITPFTSKGELDLEALDAVVEMYLKAGVGGLFANCLSSEMFHLSDEERLEITRQTIKSVDGKVPVIATGSFGKPENETVDFSKQLMDLGAAAVIINSNQLCGKEATEDEFWGLLNSLIENSKDIPLGVYECPVPYKRLLSPEILAKMAASDRFLYFKDTSCDNDNIKAKLNNIKGSNLGLFNANIPTAKDSMLNGALGISPIGANYFPELYASYYRFFKDETKKSEFEKLNTFLTVIDPLIHECYPFSAKWVLQQRGLKLNTFTRTGYTKFASQDYIKFDQLIAACSSLMDELSIVSAIK